ncbi:MAG: hypothetical protein CMI54_07350 [Parcubacteria group bacterium]|nr:hypothetical protein [Parcubacteria group bacterium]|tara:strand:- start:553 stop:834 length:282 start_codon:yes stop_codon:yes gene_type:complete
MKTNQRYKLELTPYFLAKDEESCNFSASHFYGKFLNYIDDDDYVGASLAKRFLRRGAERCEKFGYENNKFKSYRAWAEKDEKFNSLKKEFFCD